NGGEEGGDDGEDDGEDNGQRLIGEDDGYHGGEDDGVRRKHEVYVCVCVFVRKEDGWKNK
nr:hypothetical protein [Tanacetum cinerariifolium]